MVELQSMKSYVGCLQNCLQLLKPAKQQKDSGSFQEYLKDANS